MSPAINNRIAKNTLILYFRQLLILLVSLYTVRIVLDELGIEDYGIYSAVGGLVAVGAFLPGSIAQATQRFFSFALGAQDEEQLRKTFSVNLILFMIVALVSLVVLQTIGLWFVDTKLVLPQGRLEAAKVLYLCASFTFIINVIATPFMAIIMAHEDMKLYAYITILDILMKLGVVFLLQYLMMDKLELYGILLLFVSLISSVVYIAVCTYKYEECQFKKLYWDYDLLREIVGFTGWTLFGQISTVARTHAITVLLNQSFSPVVVAARALSVQIASQVDIFSSNFNASLYPPIVKSYAANDREGMYGLITGGGKITFFLLWIFALPMIMKIEEILNIWLTVVPAETVLFAQLALVESLIVSISLPIAAAARAPGRMQAYELTLGSIQIGVFFISWLVITHGAPPYSVFVIAILANICMFGVRLYLVKKLIGFPVGIFLRHTALPVLIIVVVSGFPIFILEKLLPIGVYWSILLIFSSILLSTIAMFFIGLDKIWQVKVVNLVRSRLSKLHVA